MANSFAAMVQDLADPRPATVNKVAQTCYQQWRHAYLFDALRNMRYGQSFCNEFGITDNILFYERDSDYADQYIKMTYLN